MTVLLAISIIVVIAIMTERIIYGMKERGDDRTSLDRIVKMIYGGVTITLLLLSYLMTDTWIGIVYVIGFFVLVFIFFHSDTVIMNKGVLKGIRIIGFPIMILMIVFSSRFIVADIFILVIMGLSINHLTIFGAKSISKRAAKSLTSGYIGGLILATFVFLYLLFGTEGSFMTKQEIVAREYIQNELNIDVIKVDSVRGIRGQETEVVAYYNGMSSQIVMVYKNGRIIEGTLPEE